MKCAFVAGIIAGVVMHRRWVHVTRRYRAAITAYRLQ
jgi:hypothetical protein